MGRSRHSKVNAEAIVVHIRREDMIANPRLEFNKLVQCCISCIVNFANEFHFSIFNIQIDLSFNETFVRRRRRRIAQVGTRIQYSAPGGFVGISNGIEDADSPTDAVNVVLRNLLRKPSDPLL